MHTEKPVSGLLSPVFSPPRIGSSVVTEGGHPHEVSGESSDPALQFWVLMGTANEDKVEWPVSIWVTGARSGKERKGRGKSWGWASGES